MIKFAVNGYLFKVFCFEIIAHYFVLHGNTLLYSILAYFQGGCELFILLYALLSGKFLKFNKGYNNFLFIFFVYISYIVYYVSCDSSLAFSTMASVGDSWYSFISSILFLVIPLLTINVIVEFADFTFIVKCLLVTTTVFFPIYFNSQTLALYLIHSNSVSFYEEMGIFNPLVIDVYAATSLLLSLYLKDKWSDNRIFNRIIFILSFLINGCVLIICAERGPFLFAIITVALYYYHKAILKSYYFGVIIFIVSCCLIITSIFPELIQNISLLNRFTEITENGGNGRFGDDDSNYVVALQQIKNNPWFGTYFRITNPNVSSYGSYPHNLILECIMTMGIFFSFYLFIIIYRAWKYACQFIKNNSEITIIALIFIYTFLSLMTSLSLYNNIRFWLPLAILNYVGYRNINCIK